MFYLFTSSSHLVIETSQEVSDVPYSDYFRVEVQFFLKHWIFMQKMSFLVILCSIIFLLKVFDMNHFSQKLKLLGKVI